MPLENLDVPSPPNPNVAPGAYAPQYHNQINNQLKLYLNRLSNNQTEIVKFIQSLTDLNLLANTNFDAFGRLRTSNPLTLFDSQNRYEKDPQFDETLAGSAASTFLTNESSVKLEVTTASGDEVVRQSKRVFPYQPGKSLLVLCTFAMAPGAENLRQRVGYFDANNGVFLQQDDDVLSLVVRTYTSGSVSDARTVAQSSWNGDKLDGSGASGITLDETKTQIFFIDFEWLGVGSIRCGFIIDGEYIVVHTFHNANQQTAVYMQTAILPIRYEIKADGTLAAGASMKQICSTVISEGGYQQISEEHVARRTAAFANVGTSFVPLVSIRLASDSLGSVIVPHQMRVLPTSSANYEVALIRNATLTGASYNTSTFAHVDFDVSATAMSGGTVVQQGFTSATNQSSSAIAPDLGYNFDLQLGKTIGGTSDVLTVAIRTISSTGDAVGSLSFYDLTG